MASRLGRFIWKGETFVSAEGGVLSGVKLLKDHIQLGARFGEKEVLGQLRAKDQKTLEQVMKVLGPRYVQALRQKKQCIGYRIVEAG